MSGGSAREDGRVADSRAPWSQVTFPAAVPHRRKDVVQLAKFFDDRLQALRSEGHTLVGRRAVVEAHADDSDSPGVTGGESEAAAAAAELARTNGQSAATAALAAELVAQQEEGTWQPPKKSYQHLLAAERGDMPANRQLVEHGEEEEEETGSPPPTEEDWRLVGECDPVCIAASKHLEVRAKSSGRPPSDRLKSNLRRLTTTLRLTRIEGGGMHAWRGRGMGVLGTCI
jgi:hypothetical protein